MKAKKGKHPAEISSKRRVKTNKEVLKRFFTDKCTSQEMQIVQKRFATTQGQKYVSKEVDKDFKLIDESFESKYTCDNKIDSAKIFNCIKFLTVY